MHRLLSLVLAFSVLPPALSAQERGIGYPQGSVSATWCNHGPLGEDAAGQFVEARTQFLIPAEYLPPQGGPVSALEHGPNWVANGPAQKLTVTYARLEITLAHRPHGKGPLNTTFAANLPSPPPPPVFAASGVTITWTVGSWNSIAFAQPFVYDGTSDLLVEIRKVVVPTGQNVCTNRNVNPPRQDLPAALMAVGGAGSGAADAVSGGMVDVLGWRLRFDGIAASTLEVRSAVDVTAKTHFTMPDPIHFRLYGGFGLPFVMLVEAGGGGLSAASWSLPGVVGHSWLPLGRPLIVFAAGTTAPAAGSSYYRIDFTLPARNPTLVGWKVALQGAVLDAGGTLAWTNGVDFILQ